MLFRWLITVVFNVTLIKSSSCQRFTLSSGQRVDSGATKLKTLTKEGDVPKINNSSSWTTLLRNSLNLSSHCTFLNPTQLLVGVYRNGMTAVMCAALCETTCKTFHFSKTSNTCETFQESYFEPFVVVNSKLDWTIGFIKQSSIVEGDWTLVFRGQKSIGVSVFDTWRDSGQVDDNPVRGSFPRACLRFSHYDTCDRHFRGHILNDWTGIVEVRFSLYKASSEVAYIVFNGTDSDNESWFATDRILDSTWAPAILNVTSFTSMGIAGINGGMSVRRFYIFQHQGCQLDRLFTMTQDSPSDSCVHYGIWNIVFDSFPNFLYSPYAGWSAPYNSAAYPPSEKADVLAVWVKFY